jgi:hypothetical protein
MQLRTWQGRSLTRCCCTSASAWHRGCDSGHNAACRLCGGSASECRTWCAGLPDRASGSARTVHSWPTAFPGMRGIVPPGRPAVKHARHCRRRSGSSALVPSCGRVRKGEELVLQHRGLARPLLPSPDDDVAVPCIELDQPRPTPGLLTGNQGRARAGKRVQHDVLRLARVPDRPLDQRYRFHGRVQVVPDRSGAGRLSHFSQLDCPTLAPLTVRQVVGITNPRQTANLDHRTVAGVSEG